MMWTENGPVSRQIVEIVHDDGNEQVDDLSGRKERNSVEGSERRVLPRTNTGCKRRENTELRKDFHNFHRAAVLIERRIWVWLPVHKRT